MIQLKTVCRAEIHIRNTRDAGAGGDGGYVIVVQLGTLNGGGYAVIPTAITEGAIDVTGVDGCDNTPQHPPSDVTISRKFSRTHGQKDSACG